jgi:hypothetical protein
MNDDIYIQEQIPTDDDAHAKALMNEQLMRNLCTSDETRSII